MRPRRTPSWYRSRCYCHGLKGRGTRKEIRWFGSHRKEARHTEASILGSNARPSEEQPTETCQEPVYLAEDWAFRPSLPSSMDTTSAKRDEAFAHLSRLPREPASPKPTGSQVEERWKVDPDTNDRYNLGNKNEETSGSWLLNEVKRVTKNYAAVRWGVDTMIEGNRRVC